MATASKATNTDRVIPGDRVGMVHWMGGRMQDRSVRGGDDEGGEGVDGVKGEDGESRGDSCDGDEVVEKDMEDERFRAGSSSTGRRRDLCFGKSRCFKTPCNPGGRGGEILATSAV